jgi:hypothetical protein
MRGRKRVHRLSFPAGMMGDRADVIFAAPSEISGFIADRC